MSWPVVIVAYDPRWPALFEEERKSLAAIFAARAIAIEHIGSTAVPGLEAKAIIDVLLGLRPLELTPSDIQATAGLGYEYRGELGIPGRHFFARGDPRTHHVHAVEHGGLQWERHLRFRDYLRDHPEEARRYGELKRSLALRHSDDREAYTDAKAPFIAAALERVGRGR